MSVDTKFAGLDDRTMASNPGDLAVSRLRYARHFPFWPVTFGFSLLASISASLIWHNLAILALVIALVNLMFWVRVRLRFQRGCVNPSVVLSNKPFLIGVYTDLTIIGTPYPVIKVLAHPVPNGCRHDVGRKCSSVALYSGSTEAEHWEDFDPILIECATDNQNGIDRVTGSIPESEWNCLETGLRQLPQPVKCGLYPIRL